ncbi:hypothetical protein ACFE04_019090 [Oxalis oulophora]
MSILAGRSAGKEAAYFFNETKQALVKHRLANKSTTPPPHPPSSTADQADILPEIMRHSLPPKLFASSSPSSSSSSSSQSSSTTLLTASKWALPTNPKPTTVSSDKLNPLRAYVSLPQVTFGPKRWQLPNEEGSVVASTANDLRNDRYGSAHVNPDKLKAAAQGLVLGKLLSFDDSRLDDIRTKGKDLAQPRLETIREQISPLRTWQSLNFPTHFDIQFPII